MTSPAEGSAGGGTTLALRLALAFLAVALAAVALLAGLTAILAATDVSALVNRQRTDLTTAVAAAARTDYERDHGWRPGDLSPVVDLIRSLDGADVQVRDSAGHVLAT